MIVTFISISIVVLIFVFVYRQILEQKKYQNTAYLNNLQQIIDFIELVQTLDDYVTWVQRAKIKSKYSAAGSFFKNKTNYYNKEK